MGREHDVLVGIPNEPPRWLLPPYVVPAASGVSAAAVTLAIAVAVSRGTAPAHTVAFVSLFVAAAIATITVVAMRAHDEATTTRRMLLGGTVTAICAIWLTAMHSGVSPGDLVVGFLCGVPVGGVLTIPLLRLVNFTCELLSTKPALDAPDDVSTSAFGQLVFIGSVCLVPCVMFSSWLAIAPLLVVALGAAGLVATLRRRASRMRWWERVRDGKDPRFALAPAAQVGDVASLLPLFGRSGASGMFIISVPTGAYREAAAERPVCLAPGPDLASQAKVTLTASLSAPGKAVLLAGIVVILLALCTYGFSLVLQ